MLWWGNLSVHYSPLAVALCDGVTFLVAVKSRNITCDSVALSHRDLKEDPVSDLSRNRVPLPTLDLAELERLAILRALEMTGGNRVRAARLLGIHVRTLHRKLRAGVVVEPEANRTNGGLASRMPTSVFAA